MHLGAIEGKLIRYFEKHDMQTGRGSSHNIQVIAFLMDLLKFS